MYIRFINHNYFNNVITIATSSLATISTYFILIITISSLRIKSFTIYTNFWSSDVIGSTPGNTRNPNLPTWKFYYSFPGRLLENPAGLHGKPLMKYWIWMDLIWRVNDRKGYLLETCNDGVDAAFKGSVAIVFNIFF